MKKEALKTIIVISIMMILSSFVSAACGTLNGDYTLIANESAGGDCFTIGTNGVTLDCDGFSINGGGIGTAVIVDSKSNVVIKDCVIDGFVTGINISNSNSVTVNNTNLSNVGTGIFIDPSDGSKVKDGHIEGNCNIGMNLDDSSNGLFEDLTISSCDTGILVSSKSSINEFSNIRISSSGIADIEDSGTGTDLSDVACVGNVNCIEPTAPFSSEFDGGFTTDFAAEGDLTNVLNLTLENGDGKIVWNSGLVDVTSVDFDNGVEIGNRFVSVNTAKLNPSFTQAQVSIAADCDNYVIYKASETYNTVVDIKNSGDICDSCTINSCTGGVLTFTIPSFSSYASGPGTNLTIWDETDSITKYTDEQVMFYANYSNATSGAPISSGACNASFQIAPTGPHVMTYNATSKYFEYNRSFSSSGTTNWNVTCAASGFANLSTTDQVSIDPVGTVPEFSTYAMLLALIIVVSGFVVMRRRYY